MVLSLAIFFAFLLILVGTMLGTGISAALSARHQVNDMTATLQDFTLSDLTDSETYGTLNSEFQDLENTVWTARSRLALLRAFVWLPWLGPRIEEGFVLLDIGSELTQLGETITGIFQEVWGLPLDSMSSEAAAHSISQILHEANLELDKAGENASRVSQLQEQFQNSSTSDRYAGLVNQYLPLIQSVLYLSLNAPHTIGESYLVYRELTALGQWAGDPFGLIESPSEVRHSLETLDRRSLTLAGSLTTVLLDSKNQEEEAISADTREALELMKEQVILVGRISRGLDALVNIWDITSSSGLFSEPFAQLAGAELDRAETEFELARDHLGPLKSLSVVQKFLGESSPVGAIAAGPDELDSPRDPIQESLELLIDLTRFIRSVFGFEGPKSYLVVLQNPNEIRATGGFIGVAVHVGINEGQLTNLTYYDSTMVDPPGYATNPTAPPGLYWHLWTERLLFRDANWDPDFPTSAAQLAQLFSDGMGVSVDGVIAANKYAALDFVDLFGDVTVPELPGLIDRERARAHIDAEVSYPCRAHHSSATTKRCFDEDLFFALWDRLVDAGKLDLGRPISQVFRKQLAHKDVLLHLFDEKANAIPKKLGWNGAVPSAKQDYLMIVDSSLPGHAKKEVKRYWEYRVSLEIEEPSRANLNIHYDNKNTPGDGMCRQASARRHGCYFNYLRVFLSPFAEDLTVPSVPLHKGTEKLAWGYTDVDSLVILESPGNHREIGGFITIEPQSILTFPISYSLAPETLRLVEDGLYRYSLFLQKQPGIEAEPVTIAVQIPVGFKVEEATPSPLRRAERWLVFDILLEQDTAIAVSFRKM